MANDKQMTPKEAAGRLRAEDNRHAQDALRFLAYGVVPAEGDFDPYQQPR